MKKSERKGGRTMDEHVAARNFLRSILCESLISGALPSVKGGAWVNGEPAGSGTVAFRGQQELACLGRTRGSADTDLVRASSGPRR